MPIAINGSGTLTGISVGGLPDGIVDADMLAADSVTAPKIGSKTFTSYAILGDVKSNNTQGGSFTSGAWRTRDINTEISDADDIVSLSSNQFTLQAGSYLIEVQATAYRVNRNMIKLYNVTASADIAFGSSMYANTGYNGGNISYLSTRITIGAARTFEIRHRCQSNNTSHGFGQASDFGNNELYLVVKIFKEA